MPNIPSIATPHEQGLRRVAMEFRSHPRTGESYLHRLSVDGIFASNSKHSFDSQTDTAWTNLNENLTVGLIGTLLVFIRTQRLLASEPGGTIQLPADVDSCDSRVAPFAMTVSGVFHKGKSDYDTWVRQIIGMGSAENSGAPSPLLRFNYKFVDVRRKDGRYWLLKLVRALEITITLDEVRLNTDQELQKVDATLLALFNTKISRFSSNGEKAQSLASQASSVCADMPNRLLKNWDLPKRPIGVRSA